MIHVVCIPPWFTKCEGFFDDERREFAIKDSWRSKLYTLEALQDIQYDTGEPRAIHKEACWLIHWYTTWCAAFTAPTSCNKTLLLL